ncbi:MAG: 4'-phosphopantetheinyl transferase superfamily protein [Oscillospiraceae bacterium]|nr:4'-phosphopantetheinyl transferase superfamily protein [Oscillospiraceae bacterium]
MDILILNYSQSLSWKELEGYLGCLTPARRRGVLKKKQGSDRINTLLSRLLVLSEITRRTGIPQNKIRFDFGNHGKPYLKNSKLQFSLSHTNGAVCTAFSSIPDDNSEIGEIGIDIENRRRRVNPVIYDRSLAEDEKPLVRSPEDFIRCWVKKEAFLKRTGFGIVCDLKGINTNLLPDTAAFDCGDLIVGASGRGALTAAVTTISLEELLGRYTKLN